MARNRKENRSEREDDETVGLMSHNPDDIEASVMTAYTSTTSLVSKAPQSHQGIEMAYWTQNTCRNEVRSRTGLTSITPRTAASSRASSDQGSSTTAVEEPDEEALMERGFGPSHLCFLKYDKDGNPIDYESHKVTDWVRDHGGHSETDYVFLSYTRAQFGVFTEEDLNDKGITDMETRRNLLRIGEFDRATLKKYGIKAAHQAGLKAFWWDFECIRTTDGSTAATVNNLEVYRICEVARAAHSMVVLVGPTVDSKMPRTKIPPFSTEAYDDWVAESGKMYNPAAFTEWMQVWGSRLWTFPEILLVPPQRPVKVFAIGGPSPPEQWEKRNFASRSVWKDAKLVRQLIDHYESSIHLEPLELFSLALECFHNRYQVQNKRFDGDPAYALMGLLRRRPVIDTTDTEFAAFARLSLANNSEGFLERLVCVQPLEVNKPWHYQKDFWGSNLWDIQPKCQVAGIADDETVILDGAYGATIRWNASKVVLLGRIASPSGSLAILDANDTQLSVEPVPFVTRRTWRRTLSQWLLRGNSLHLAIATFFAFGFAFNVFNANAQAKRVKAENDRMTQLGLSPSTTDPPGASPLQIGGLVLSIFELMVTTGILLAAPALILNFYVGKFWDTQASFVGMEGVPSDLGTIEAYLFGCNHGRLSWSAAGSALSRHRESAADEKGACIGLPPRPRCDAGESGDALRPFTVVDTFSMTATAFRAARPPTAVIVCGQEGGMQRAALCSYDWKRNTFSREQVIRLQTSVLDRMSRMDRFRFSFKRRCGDPASRKRNETT